jgi:ComEC/Rec2-related protein
MNVVIKSWQVITGPLLYFQSKLEEEYHHLSLWYFVSFLFGIVFYFASESLPIKIIALAFIVNCFTGYYFRNKLIIRFITLNLAGFCIGIFASDFRVLTADSTPIDQMITTELTGTVDSVRPTLRGAQFILTDVHLLNGGRRLNKVRINISSELADTISGSDIIKLKAKLFPLQKNVLPGTFDFGFFMHLQGFEASGYSLSNPVIIQSKNREIKDVIQTIRSKVYQRLISVLGENSGNFVAAILIGETKAIPVKIANDVRNSGIAHILSVSGLHLSLVAMLFFVTGRVLLNFSNFLAYKTNIKSIAAVISIVGSFLYLLLSGSNIAATRAFIMTMIFIIAVMMGRAAYSLRSVMIAAGIILLFTPEYALHPSFQLSFSAVLCLISGYEFFLKYKNLLENSKGLFAQLKFYVFTNIYTSFLGGVVTGPFVIYHFYKFSVYSILMNLIAVPIMSFFMMPLAILAFILMPFGIDFIVLKVLGFFVKFVIDASGYISALPGAVWYTGYITGTSLAVFSFGFFWICLWKTGWRFAGLIIIFVSLIMMLVAPKPDLIYDHRFKAVGLRNREGKLEIYADKKIPSFTLNYLANWYGLEKVTVINKKIAVSDHVFKTNSGLSIAINYWHCNPGADLQIITSKKLKCGEGAGVVTNKELSDSQSLAVYSNKNSCRAKLNNRKKE